MTYLLLHVAELIATSVETFVIELCYVL